MPTLTVNLAYDEPGAGVSPDPGQTLTVQALNEVVEVDGGVTYIVDPAPHRLTLSGGVGSIDLEAGYYWVHRWGSSKLVHLVADARLDELASLDPASLDPAAPLTPAWQAEADELDARVTALEQGGSGGGGVGFQYSQATPLASWLVAHSFGRLPNVAVYVDGEEVIADVTATASEVAIAFASPTAGVAVLT